ncbi:MAG: hypothetical protein H0X01_06505 [Nitrospira sp.]|nr:hypothetical protein [Nitrospira sp.]
MSLIDRVLLTIHTTTALFFLWLFVFVLWRAYCEDKLRQDVFALRDTLFDYAHSGAIGFDHQAYAVLRTRMNGLIRFAHRATWTHIFLIFLFTRKSMAVSVDESNSRWQEAFSQLHQTETRLKLREFHDHMQLLIAKHLIRGSLILTPTLLIGVATVDVWKRLTNNMPGLGYVEVEAEQIGAMNT